MKKSCALCIEVSGIIINPLYYLPCVIVHATVPAGTRFDQSGYHVYSKLEELVLKAVNKESFEEELKFLIDFYKDDFNEGQLRVQLDILGSNIPAEAKPRNLSSILEYV